LAGQTLEHEDSGLKQYALSHGQPVELSQDRSYVLTAQHTGYKSSSRVLDSQYNHVNVNGSSVLIIFLCFITTFW